MIEQIVKSRADRLERIGRAHLRARTKQRAKQASKRSARKNDETPQIFELILKFINYAIICLNWCLNTTIEHLKLASQRMVPARSQSDQYPPAEIIPSNRTIRY